jgi:hypothetical protein
MADVERVITSACDGFRAEIVPLPTGGFTVTVFELKEEWTPGYGRVGEFWGRTSNSLTIADTRERAEGLVGEEFRSLGTTGPESAEG